MLPFILYDNRFADAAPTATGTAAGTDARHVSDGRTFTWWQAAASGTNYLTVDAAAARPANTLAICRHNLATAAAQVSVESSDNGSSWTQRLAPFASATDDALARVFIDAAARYWRLKIVTAAVAPRLAVVNLGRRLDFPVLPEAPFIPYTERVESESSRSKGGHALGEVVSYHGHAIKAEFRLLPRDWYFGQCKDWWEGHARWRKWFFWAWDLGNYPADVFFCRHDGEWAPPLSLGAWVDSLSLPMEAVR